MDRGKRAAPGQGPASSARGRTGLWSAARGVAIVQAMRSVGPARRARDLLPGALLVLVLADVAGGLMDVAAGRSRLADAWSSRATLCAPWPMIVSQGVLTSLAIRWTGVPSRVAAGLLAVGCGVSIASGFFDGQLARRDLSSTEVGFQALLLGATGLLGGLAAAVATTE